ncbi:GAF domain-containing sensor histidine kinase [Azospirillum sp. sgz302134]
MPDDTPFHPPAPRPPEETGRIKALEQYRLRITGKEPEFDRIARLAADLFRTPIALVNLVLDDVQTSLGACGIEGGTVPRDLTFCAHAILSDEVMVVPDARLDPRFARNPFVTGPPGIRFYAGAPLRVGGHRVGSLCVVDDRPRGFGHEERRRLAALAATVADLMTLRLGHRIAEESRERAEGAFRQVDEVLDAMPAGVAIYDAGDRLLRTNRRYRDLYHPEAAGVVQPGQTRAEVLTALAERGHCVLPTDHGDGPARRPQEVRLADGRWLRRLERRTASGLLIVVNTDVTALKDRELALSAQTALLHSTLENIEQGLAVFDAELRLLVWNERFFDMLRLPEDLRRAGTPVTEVARVLAERGELGEGPAEEVVGRTVGTMRALPTRRFELATRDGRTLDVWRARMPDGRHVVTYADITQRKRMERMKDEFLSTVSHELRTPLTSIAGALGLLGAGAGGALDDKARHLIAIAHKNAERLIRLINDLLDIGKMDAGKVEFRMQRLALGPFLRQAVEQHRPYAARFGVSLDLPPVPDLAVMADPDRLLQAVGNLLSNAIKFSPQGQTVAVAAALRDDGFARITVTDRGEGIPEAFRGRIFERFAQADGSARRRHEGSGLGLSITRSIVERHGGRVGFTTESGRGTTFHIDLPPAGGPNPQQFSPP